MRVFLLAAAFLILGALLGGVAARQEFADDLLPIDGLSPALAAANSDGASGPRLTVLTPERYEFGAMDENAKMRHEFEIRNDGDAPLTITKEGTSCKCTESGLVKEQLLPKETAKITLEWTATGGGEEFEQYADYKTNDPLRPKFRLVVAGRVRAALRSDPMEVVFNRVSSQESARAAVKLFGLGSDELKILTHKFTHAKSAPFFRLEFRPLAPSEFPADSEYQSGVEMLVDLKPGLPLGQLDQSIQLTTSLNPEATFEIPVYGTIVSDISLVGPNTSVETMTVDLGSIKSPEGAKSTVYLVVKGSHRDETQLSVASVSPAAELSAAVGEPIRNNPQIVSYPVTLQVKTGATPVSRISAGSRVVVRIATTHPQIKEVVLYVRYAVVD